ncbi:hypothetical protein Gohar_017413 [Gossypium harknessii]|uniref:Uncharacterized protein n=1 Tax=Gossypium harknessii TaxID=34285 RepID=A0A7J9G6K5_9ROSI|nr:hypothetical protein [Gossypium harknessii]
MPTNSRIASIRPNTNRRLISGDFENCIDWLEASIGLLEKKALADFITLLGTVGKIGTTSFLGARRRLRA